MRSAIFCLAILTLVASRLPSQERSPDSRFTLAAGLTWNESVTGMQLQAQHQFLRGRWFGLRAEAGTRWTPTQFTSDGRSIRIGDGEYQLFDLHLALSAMVGPGLRGPVAPYLVIGGAALQTWKFGRAVYEDPGLGQARVYSYSWTHGAFAALGGLGIRLHIGHRPVQAEVRYLLSDEHLYEVMIGTALRF